jgi:hypothetical protein
MSLKTRDAQGPSDSVMTRPGRQLEAITFAEVDGLSAVRKTKPDGAAIDDDDLVVGMCVRAVLRTRSVRPAARSQALLAQPSAEIVGHR